MPAVPASDAAPERLSDEEIEARLRERYGDKLDACQQLHAFVDEALLVWQGRPFEPNSGDSLILAESARAAKTYAAVLHLVAGGFGPQGSMLVRSLFEGMAVAHWTHANSERAVDLFVMHSRQGELLWGDVLEQVDDERERSIDAGTTEERDELAKLFGRYGAKLWTGHGNLHGLLVDIEDQWGDDDGRRHLWTYFRVVQRDNNQILHSTALGLSATVIGRSANEIELDGGRSSHYLDRALVGGTWSFGQTASLLWDHFELPDRTKLDELFDSAWSTFLRAGISVEPELTSDPSADH
jgi:hypothetical protein